MDERTKELLQKQLELLSEHSPGMRTDKLATLSSAMVDIANLLCCAGSAHIDTRLITRKEEPNMTKLEIKAMVEQQMQAVAEIKDDKGFEAAQIILSRANAVKSLAEFLLLTF